MLRSGCAWRMLPRALPPWHTVYRWYRRWAADGTFTRLHDILRDRLRTHTGRDPAPTAAIPDARSIVTGEGGSDLGYDAGKRTRGRKRHLKTGASAAAERSCAA
ncbi:transposase [Saccharopolyspora sp. NPDC047091]|uniref:transposase n=1 Tax=Saccharopolyspora sp. NPDC047091 TaxID=3155924 RepID=UPI0033D8916B